MKDVYTGINKKRNGVEYATYGLTQSMVHGVGDYVANCAEMVDKEARVITIAPNLQLAEKVPLDAGEELSVDAIAEYIYMWANAEAGLPSNGAIVGFKGKQGVAIPELL